MIPRQVVAGGLLPHPPEPVPKFMSEVDLDVQTVPTPPPSPGKRAISPDGGFEYWGLLKPLDSEAPFKNWFFSRDQDIYSIGSGEKRDICVIEPVMLQHQCSFIWDSTDNPDAVRIIDYSSPPNPNGLCTGTFVNQQRLEDGVPRVLRHGDEVRIYPTACMGPYEDLNFKWLQCTSEGWLPLLYKQYSWPPSPNEYWGMGEF